jgi:N4-gp56 family major capsid protein
MADTSTSTLTNLIQTAYDKYVEFNLRSEPMFRKFADKRPVDVTNPGATVVFQLHNDLSRISSPLTETSDVSAVALNNTNKVQVTVNEYGNAVTTTERLALESLSAIDPAVADMLSYNMRDSFDALVYQTLVGLATGRYAGTVADDETTVNGVDKTTESTTTLQAADIRKAVAKLRGANVQPRDGGFYIGMLHPDTSYDLRTEAAASGANVWREPHTYTEAGVGNIWNGEVGVYEGVKFIESARVEQASNGITRTVSNKALTSNVATLTTSAAHGFEVGETVTVAGVDATFNGSFTVASVPSATTFTYAKTASNVSSASATGTATSLDHKVIVMGKQALLEAVSYEPKTVVSPITDKLMRFRSVGYKGLLGWNIYRPEARYVISCTSSI